MLWKMADIAHISIYIKYIYAVENGRYSTDLFYICHYYATHVRCVLCVKSAVYSLYIINI